MASDSSIIITGAREHNLRNVSLTLPRDRLIVFTGVSGSGKSSLAFDTIYAEGQRRYVESLSSAARQYLGQLKRPDVDRIEGLSPAIAIGQKATDSNPRSTVATVTEIYDYLRVFYARLGQIVCCGQPVGRQTAAEMVQRIADLPARSRVQLLAPVALQRKGEFQDVFDDARKAGFVRVRVDGEVLDLSQTIELDRQRRHTIEIVVDRLVIKPDVESRLSDSVELALRHGSGQMIVNVIPPDDPAEAQPAQDLFYSREFSCPQCGTSYVEPSPQLFSFNSVQGMCKGCQGLGAQAALDLDLLVPDHGLSIAEGAVASWGVPSTLRVKHILDGVSKHFGFSLKTPWRDLPEAVREVVLHGSDESIKFVYKSHGGKSWPYTGQYGGVMGLMSSTEDAFEEEESRGRGGNWLKTIPCEDCAGERLCAEARRVQVDGVNISQLCARTIVGAAEFFDELKLYGQSALIGTDLVREIRGRLNFLLNVGLHYLTLDRPAPTLSGGEGQRIRLASQIGAGLVGVTYVLDEPSIGLHHRDNRHLLSTLQRLRDLGNTVIVVEHDEETMRAADFLVDVGPGPGRLGGEIVAAGLPEEVARCERSLTAKYLNGETCIEVPTERRPRDPERVLRIFGAEQNNLRNIDVELPLKLFVCITGVSGSGKSSLINDILHNALARDLNGAQCSVGKHRALEGLEHLDKVISIDQSPIGRTPRSNPATYTKALDPIRQLFARLPDAKVRGYGAGRFSFNVHGGRCEACEGRGYQRIEMDFLEDVWVECEVCGGTRFNSETLQVKFKGKSIADVLAMPTSESLELFSDVPAIAKVLRTLCDVGLDYIQLGQPAPTLSGGEAQRIKLARELARRGTGRTMYLLDEPTTGLHFEDIRKLLGVLQRFVAEGNSVVVIEHNLDVIKTADWLLDLGPDGGAGGGLLVGQGTPEEVAALPGNYTGESLREVLGLQPKRDLRLAPSDESERPAPWAPLDAIVVKGARAHNLQNIDATVPRGKLTVLTGVSGSGKSSLALDTIYAEGQRRYVESLSSYARQFIRQLEKPPVDFVSGLSPAISIEQRPGSRNPRSTVGTVTEIHDYLRLIWSRLGTRHCVDCGAKVGRQSADEMAARLLAYPEGTRALVLAPLQLAKNEEYVDAFERLKREGFLRVRVDGTVRELDETIAIDRRRKHKVEVVVDRLALRPEERTRLGDAVELALAHGDGQMLVEILAGAEAMGIRPGDVLFSTRWTCSDCGRAYDELGPQHFSFNSPLGWCPECEGLGSRPGIDPERLLARPELPFGPSAIPLLPLVNRRRPVRVALEGVAKLNAWPLSEPLERWPAAALQELLHGADRSVPYVTDAGAKTTVRFVGLVPVLGELFDAGTYTEEIAEVRGDLPCPSCHGARLRPEAAAVRFRDVSLVQLESMALRESGRFFGDLLLSEREQLIAVEPMREVRRRLQFLLDVGLDYLGLGRPSGTLSGGEAMRIRLASQIGSGLTGVLYILDEPTIGLHQRDNARLLGALENLRDLGNTVLMVEHDPEAIRRGDHLLDFGPGAGSQGGRVVAYGSPAEVARNPESLTGDYLSGRRAIEVPPKRRAGLDLTLSILGARHHNLRNVDAHFPLGTLTAVTGVSGSGKSSLVVDILYPVLARALHRARIPVGGYAAIEGLEYIDKVISIDQRPIGDNPRSNPASYVGVFDLMRELYAGLPEARIRGFTEARFSFNRPGGRCEACAGFGSRKVEMHFLADVWVPCEACEGQRYNAETLAVTFKGASISQVLEMTVDQALAHFSEVPRIRRALQTLSDVGLGYVQLGQSALTLSGGEAQRVKLARELSRPSTGSTLYVLDEPTTGLHFEDIRRLLEVLNRLVDAGNTVVVIEHNLEVIKCADHVIDLGPEGGDGGGAIIATGPPEVVAQTPGSHTGLALQAVLEPGRELVVEASSAAIEVIANPDERWHRRQMAFSQRSDAVWHESDLVSLLALVRATDPRVSLPDWRNKDFVSLGVEGSRRWWARIRTSRPDALRLVLRTASGRCGAASLARQTGLVSWETLDPSKGRQGPRVVVKPEDGEDLVAFDFVAAAEWRDACWAETLKAMLAGFLESGR